MPGHAAIWPELARVGANSDQGTELSAFESGNGAGLRHVLLAAEPGPCYIIQRRCCDGWRAPLPKTDKQPGPPQAHRFSTYDDLTSAPLCATPCGVQVMERNPKARFIRYEGIDTGGGAVTRLRLRFGSGVLFTFPLADVKSHPLESGPGVRGLLPRA
jgi:hypothetical protein